VGFVTFGVKNGTPQLYGALEAKLAGAIRGNISNASNIGQSLLLTAYANPLYGEEKEAKHAVLKRRYEKMRDIFRSHPEYAEVLRPLPFNSGYFMCVRLTDGNAEAVRQKLLSVYDTGIIAFGDVIRIAFSSTPYPQLEKLLDNIYKAGREVRKE
jgi:aspartate/tyrosine/aromatic aminotransferase